MENKHEISEEFLRERKFAVVLPLIVFPFITIFFSLLGGGKGLAASVVKQKDALNYELPAPVLQDDSHMSKLDYYEKSDRDSAKWREVARRDPNYENKADVESKDLDFASFAQKDNVVSANRAGVVEAPYGEKPVTDKNVTMVQQKLDELNRVMSQKETSIHNADVVKDNSGGTNIPSAVSADVEQLEKMMKSLQDGNQDDPEMAKLDGMLDKILDIQYPDRVREKVRKLSAEHKEVAYPVNVANDDNITVSSIDKHASNAPKDSGVEIELPSNRFYSIDDGLFPEEEDNAISAEIPEYQTLVSGSTLKMRITNDVYIAGRLVPKNSYVYGAVAVNGERLQVEINSIRTNNTILSVALAVYDQDGMAGIYVPGAIARDVSKNSADQTIQSMPIMSMDPSLGVQAASAGIETAKSLLSKKVKLIKVTVKAGYQVLLRNRQG
ncbi:conjugative transposon protein TraM [Chitinophaga silvatica]|nr:conjugative transposon protein TraM [Chitinophaga silvatica]